MRLVCFITYIMPPPVHPARQTCCVHEKPSKQMDNVYIVIKVQNLSIKLVNAYLATKENIKKKMTCRMLYVNFVHTEENIPTQKQVYESAMIMKRHPLSEAEQQRVSQNRGFTERSSVNKVLLGAPHSN